MLDEGARAPVSHDSARSLSYLMERLPWQRADDGCDGGKGAKGKRESTQLDSTRLWLSVRAQPTTWLAAPTSGRARLHFALLVIRDGLRKMLFSLYILDHITAALAMKRVA